MIGSKNLVQLTHISGRTLRSPVSTLLPAGLLFCLALAGCTSSGIGSVTNGSGPQASGSTATTGSSGQTSGNLSVPSNVCSLLSTSQLQTVTGVTWSAPASITFPDGVPELVQQDCKYTAGDGSGLVFIIYADPSVGDAVTNFANFKKEFGSQGDVSLSGQGDEAYVDSNNAIHVRKANVRFYIDLGLSSGDDSATVSDEKQLSQAVLSGL
jgi:hypothetical protein